MRSRIWLRVAGWVLSLACVVLFGMRLAPLLSDGRLPVALGSIRPGLLATSFTLYLSAYCTFALAWKAVLAALRTRLPVRLAAGIFATAQFGKYLPGNVAQHLGRVIIAKSHGVPATPVVASMLLEAGLIVLASLVLGIPEFLSWIPTLGLEGLWDQTWARLGGCVVVVLVVVIASRLQYTRRLLAPLRTAPRQLPRPSMPSVAQAFALILVGLALSATALAVLDPKFRLIGYDALPTVISIFCASWVLGFFTPGAPAGLGVRELILSIGLTPLVGQEVALAITICFRFVSTLSDAIVFGTGLLLLRGRPYVETPNPDE